MRCVFEKSRHAREVDINIILKKSIGDGKIVDPMTLESWAVGH